MNTAVARRLAIGDRVIWIGEDGYQPTVLGTVTRVTAHEVEVRWDSGPVTLIAARATSQPWTCETHLRGGGSGGRAAVMSCTVSANATWQACQAAE
jgi:hypothetical protein